MEAYDNCAAFLDNEVGTEKCTRVETPSVGKAADVVQRPHVSCNRTTSAGGFPCTPLKLIADAGPGSDSKLSLDAWSVEDWSSADHFSPVSTGCDGSPSSAARRLNAPQRVVADAVLSELQVGMESAMQRAASQMSTWITGEIVLARQGLEDDIRKQIEEVRSTQCINLKRSQDELERILADVEQKVVAEQSMKEEMGCQKVAAPRSSQESFASAQVMEARVVADERRWRMKLDGIESTLEKHLESIDSLGKQLTVFSCRFASHDVDLRDNSHAIQRMDAQINSSGEKGRLDTATQLETHLGMIESLRKRCCDVEAQVAPCDIASLTSAMEARLSAEEAERIAMKMAFNKRFDELDMVGKQENDLVNQVALHDAALKDSSQGIERLELKLSAAEKVQDDFHNLTTEQIQELNEASQAQIFAAEHMHAQMITDGKAVTKCLSKIKQEFNTRLETKVDCTQFATSMATCANLSISMEKQLQDYSSELNMLARELSTKSNGADVDVVRSDLKAWVASACQTQRCTAEQLSAQFEQVRTSTEAQNGILKQHDLLIKGIIATSESDDWSS